MAYNTMPPLPTGGYQQLATEMGQPEASYAYNPVTSDMPFDLSVLGEDALGMPLDRSMSDDMDMGMGAEGMEMGMEMGEMSEEDEMAQMRDPKMQEAAMAALQGKAIQRQSASDSFQANATKLARTMRGPQSL